MLKRPNWLEGRILELEHTSTVLADNPLGDPVTRRLLVWLPPQYDRDGLRARPRRLPVLFDLAAYTASGPAHVAWRGFEENLPERLARLLHEKRMGPCIVVFPDCFTALGGNQYVNTPAIGQYADYLTRELVPFVDAELRTLADRAHRGCFGKSSGGYGALVHGMKYWRTWGAVACHAGDAYFDFVYRSGWPATLTLLSRFAEEAPAGGERRRQPAAVRKAEDSSAGTRSDAGARSSAGARSGAADSERKAAEAAQTRRRRTLAEGLDDGRVARFLEHVWQKPRLAGDEIHALMNLCMAASYDPDPAAPNGFRLPFDLDTGELLPARWRQWLTHDPVNMVARHRRALQNLLGLWIDCGWRDQYHIHFGARQLSARLTEAGVEHVYEEFDGTHSGIDHRLERSLPYLYRALAPA